MQFIPRFKCDRIDVSKYAEEITQLLKAFQERYALLNKFDNSFNILCAHLTLR